jgi:hypothetical protein
MTPSSSDWGGSPKKENVCFSPDDNPIYRSDVWFYRAAIFGAILQSTIINASYIFGQDVPETVALAAIAVIPAIFGIHNNRKK